MKCHYISEAIVQLTHWGAVTHVCVSNLTIIGSDNGLSPGRRQAIIWNNDGILLIGPLGTNFNEILIEIHTFSLKKMPLKTSSAKRRPFCLDLNVLTRGRQHGIFASLSWILLTLYTSNLWLKMHQFLNHAVFKNAINLNGNIISETF